MSERWQYSRCDDGSMMIHTEGDVIAFVDQNKAHPEDEMAASRIVNAINSQADLLEACHKVVNNWGDLHPKDLMQLRGAIAKAEGRS